MSPAELPATVPVSAPSAVLASTPAPVVNHGHPRRWLILSIVLVVEIMDLLDGTIVNVAAPTIRADLGASTTALQWIVGGYALALAVGLVVGGRLGDLFGRRRLFMIGIALFTVSSLLSGIAPDTRVLIVFRLTQGLAAALMIPQGFGIIRSAFSTEDLPKAFGLFGPVIGLSAVFGPIVGGLLVGADLFGTGWRLVFLINLPLGILAFVGALAGAPGVQDHRCDAAGLARRGARRPGRRAAGLSPDPRPGGRLGAMDVRDDGVELWGPRPVRLVPAAPRADRARPADHHEPVHQARVQQRSRRHHAVLRRVHGPHAGDHALPAARARVLRAPRGRQPRARSASAWRSARCSAVGS